MTKDGYASDDHVMAFDRRTYHMHLRMTAKVEYVPYVLYFESPSPALWYFLSALIKEATSETHSILLTASEADTHTQHVV